MLEEDRNISIEEFFKRHSRKKDGTIIGGAKKIEKLVDRKSKLAKKMQKKLGRFSK